MFAMITTEEYKELLKAKDEAEFLQEEMIITKAHLTKSKSAIKDLILFITKGETKSKWNDGNFEGFDLAKSDDIAKYINENYMKDGRLIFSKENGDE